MVYIFFLIISSKIFKDDDKKIFRTRLSYNCVLYTNRNNNIIIVYCTNLFCQYFDVSYNKFVFVIKIYIHNIAFKMLPAYNILQLILMNIKHPKMI